MMLTVTVLLQRGCDIRTSINSKETKRSQWTDEVCSFFLIDLALVARTLWTPQLLHLLVYLSIASSPVLRLHAQLVFLICMGHVVILVFIVLFLLLLALDFHTNLVFQVQRENGAQAHVSVQALRVRRGGLGAVALFDGGGVGRLVADGRDVATAVGVVDRGRVGQRSWFERDLPGWDFGNGG